ncbi:MAG: hypothetical protein VYC34_03910, partial [Planctomycetota bacterium]|nr:hypothetical protein [Planctomycetota bacterium]
GVVRAGMEAWAGFANAAGQQERARELVEQGSEQSAAVAPLRGRVLVHDTVGASADESVRQRVREAIDRMRRAGYEPVGVAGGEEDRELRASLMNTIGVGTPNDPDTQKRVGAWLAEHPEVDGVAWIVQTASGDGASPWIIAGEGLDAVRVKHALNLR